MTAHALKESAAFLVALALCIWWGVVVHLALHRENVLLQNMLVIPIIKTDEPCALAEYCDPWP